MSTILETENFPLQDFQKLEYIFNQNQNQLENKWRHIDIIINAEDIEKIPSIKQLKILHRTLSLLPDRLLQECSQLQIETTSKKKKGIVLLHTEDIPSSYQNTKTFTWMLSRKFASLVLRAKSGTLSFFDQAWKTAIEKDAQHQSSLPILKAHQEPVLLKNNQTVQFTHAQRQIITEQESDWVESISLYLVELDEGVIWKEDNQRLHFNTYFPYRGSFIQRFFNYQLDD